MIQTSRLTIVLAAVAKLSPASFRAFLRMGSEAGPTPCNFNSSFSVMVDSDFKLTSFSRSKALRAGADSKDKKPSAGFFSCSQKGQTGQSLLLVY